MPARVAGRLAVVAAALSFATPARADEWTVPKPKSAPTGEPVALRTETSDVAKMPAARVRVLSIERKPGAEPQEKSIHFDARTVRPDGGAELETRLSFTKVVSVGEDLTPKVRTVGGAKVFSRLGADGTVAEGTSKGMAGLGHLGALVDSIGGWLFPAPPPKPVRIGEAWDVPVGRFLWSVGQHGDLTASGHATRVLEAMEDFAGAPCARIRTVASLKKVHKAGAASVFELGPGETVARFRVEGTEWIGLDGCLRRSRLDLRTRMENAKTKRVFEARLVRAVDAGPAGDAPATKDWSAAMGSLPFVVGYEAGLAESKFVGKPPMFLVAEHRAEGTAWLARAFFSDPKVVEGLSAYVPAIVDGEEDLDSFPKKDAVVAQPAVVWLDFDGDVIFVFVAGGSAPPEILHQVLEVAVDRAPAAKPTPEQTALEGHRDALRAALEGKKVPDALREVAAIRAVGRGEAIQREARAAEAALSDEGERRLDEAADRLRSKPTEARAALEGLVAEYGEHAVGREAAVALARMLPKKK